MVDPFTPKAGYGQDLGKSLIGDSHIIRLDEHRVLKKSRKGLQEANTTQYIADNTTIPVPTIYDTKYDEEKDIFYIVMDYIPGEPLDKAWKNLTHDQRVSACGQIAEYLAQLQNLKGERIEGVNGAPVRVGLYQSRWGGPFDSEEEFNNFLVQGAQHHRLTNNHNIHFAHGDLSPRNILVDKTGHITAILDWEWAGWYPEYWDVVRMFLDLPGKRQMPEYAELLRSALPCQYKEEFSAMLHVIRLGDSGPGGVPVQPVPPPSSN